MEAKTPDDVKTLDDVIKLAIAETRRLEELLAVPADAADDRRGRRLRRLRWLRTLQEAIPEHLGLEGESRASDNFPPAVAAAAEKIGWDYGSTRWQDYVPPLKDALAAIERRLSAIEARLAAGERR